MRTISKTFLTGLVTVVPVVVTFYLLYWLAVSAEALLGRLIRHVLPGDLYRPGLGVLAGLIIVFFVGLLMKAWIFRSLFQWWEGLFTRIPLIKSVYGAIKDFLQFVSGPGKGGADGAQVVTVSFGATGVEFLGLVTRSDLSPVSPSLAAKDAVAVYLPLSYQIGGITAMVPRTALRPVEMTVEEAMRFSLTAGMTKKEALEGPHHPPAGPGS